MQQRRRLTTAADVLWEPSRFAVLAGLGPCCACGRWKISGLFPIAWRDFVDYSANGCCGGEKVQFIALFFAGSATLVDYFVGRFPRSVASLGGKGVPHASRAGGAPGRGEQGGSRSNVRRRAGTRTPHPYQFGRLLGRPALASSGVWGKSRPKLGSGHSNHRHGAGVRGLR